MLLEINEADIIMDIYQFGFSVGYVVVWVVVGIAVSGVYLLFVSRKHFNNGRF